MTDEADAPTTRPPTEEATAGTPDGGRCLSVVMPCFNEAPTVATTLRRVLRSPLVGEVIVVDDASTDTTVAEVRSVPDPRIRLICQPVNLGKGAALRRGFREVRLPFVVIQDADLEYDPAEYPLLVGPLRDGVADVVYGSRFLSGRPHRVLFYWHAVGNRVLTTASNMFTNLNLTDMETCYKAFRREVLTSLHLQEDRFGIEPEITAKVAAGGWRVWEVGISYAGRTYAEGKKIGWRDGVRALFSIARYSPLAARLRARVDRLPDRSLPPAPFDDSDAELETVLASLEHAPRYTDWIASLLEPHLGATVLEIGAGHGELTQRLQVGRRVTATDLSKRCVEALEERFATHPNVEVVHADVASIGRAEAFDTVVVVNVLEHIEDHNRAVAEMATYLKPGGRLCVFVPAFEGLYSEFDRRIGHRRRYQRSELVQVFADAGLEVVEARYVNVVGAFAWWLTARRLGRVPTSPSLVRVYDRTVVPLLRRLEAGRSPWFGQSLLCVGVRPAAGDGGTASA